jgi:hypothetical protein
MGGAYRVIAGATARLFFKSITLGMIVMVLRRYGRIYCSLGLDSMVGLLFVDVLSCSRRSYRTLRSVNCYRSKIKTIMVFLRFYVFICNYLIKFRNNVALTKLNKKFCTVIFKIMLLFLYNLYNLYSPKIND